MMKARKAFTLVELLVVIAIIAVLMSVLMPALQKARLQATCAVCLGNQRTLAMAYSLYTDDNDGRLVYSLPGWPAIDAWVGWPVAEDGTLMHRGSTDPAGTGGDFATLQDRLRGIRAGELYPYVETTDVYHCPGDRRIMDGTFLGSSLVHRLYRTYSIQFGLNGGYADTPTRMSQIKNPGAVYAFVEEYGFGGCFNCNSGYILNPISRGGSWWSTIAIWHGDVGTLGFVDGHAEKRKWVDERTVDLYYSVFVEPYQPDNPDLRYMFMGYGLKGDQSWVDPG